MLNSAKFVEREKWIKEQADILDQLAAGGLSAILRDPLQIDRVHAKLQTFGKPAPDGLVSNVAQAMIVLTRGPASGGLNARLEREQYVMDYRGCEITWPRVRIDSSRWTVNIVSSSFGLMAKLGGRVVIHDGVSIKAAVARARRYIDGAFR